MRTPSLLVIALLLACVGAAYGGYRYWFHEEPRATGPLAQALVAQFDPDARRQVLDDVIDAHIDPQMPLSQRLDVLTDNGFDCVIRPALVAGNQELSCRRPIEGRYYCDRINYYAYQTAEGEIIESLASIYRVEESDKVFGRCPYAPPQPER